MRTETITTRVDPAIKKAAAAVFKPLGLTTSEAINIFLYKAIDERGIPFSLKRPNKKTQQAIENARTGKNMTRYASVAEARAAMED